MPYLPVYRLRRCCVAMHRDPIATQSLWAVLVLGHLHGLGLTY